jgi:hypothetical protein
MEGSLVRRRQTAKQRGSVIPMGAHRLKLARVSHARATFMSCVIAMVVRRRPSAGRARPSARRGWGCSSISGRTGLCCASGWSPGTRGRRSHRYHLTQNRRFDVVQASGFDWHDEYRFVALVVPIHSLAERLAQFAYLVDGLVHIYRR